jgi:hypothetical protein
MAAKKLAKLADVLIPLLDKHADKSIKYLRMNQALIDEKDTRALIWNQMSALLSDFQRHITALLKESKQAMGLNDPRDWTGCTTIDTKTYRAIQRVVRAAKRLDIGGSCPAGSNCEQCNLTRALAALDKLGKKP